MRLLVVAWRAAQQNDGDRRALTLALAAGFVLTPILWLHYLVLLVVPIALARPRLSLLWFVPLSLTLFELLDWYRGWPRGDAGPAVCERRASWPRVVFVGVLSGRSAARLRTRLARAGRPDARGDTPRAVTSVSALGS